MANKKRKNVATRCHAHNCGELDDCARCRGTGVTRTFFGRERACHICHGTGRLCPVHGNKYLLSPPKRRLFFFSAGEAGALPILEDVAADHLASDGGAQ